MVFCSASLNFGLLRGLLLLFASGFLLPMAAGFSLVDGAVGKRGTAGDGVGLPVTAFGGAPVTAPVGLPVTALAGSPFAGVAGAGAYGHSAGDGTGWDAVWAGHLRCSLGRLTRWWRRAL